MDMILTCPWATQPPLQASLSCGISKLAWLSLITTRSLSSIHALINSPAHSINHLAIHAFIYLHINPLHSIIHSFIYWLTDSFICSFIH